MELKSVEGRGRGLVATRTLQAGEVVLRESPVLVYAEAEAARTGLFCSNCTRCISFSSSSSSSCPRCGTTRFCSADCHAAAEKSSHSPWVCSALADLVRLGLDPEAETQARFLIAAAELAVRNQGAFHLLLSLDGDPSRADDRAGVAGIVEGLLRKNGVEILKLLSMETMLALLAKDKKNAFGLMAPTSPDGLRKVRSYALFAKASMFNHDCLPNACRFEYLDKPGKAGDESNMDIYVRMLHEVAEGSEICLSYFPINWSFAERQKRLLDDYGFECGCARCKIERNWGDDGGEAMDQDGGDELDEAEADDDRSCERQMENPTTTMATMEEDDEAGDDFPHAMFFVKYLCPSELCGGTMAPLPEHPLTMECNVCGRIRTEDEFVRDLEQSETMAG